ncbi:hypothetical protein BofuT4_P089630.1 [Botrytis cinerea T4]|uniref:Uncharacterized protein n=1 Tax=Botryotinia fuckeliana (strain T4) TaxID=999810 RepID=G2YFL6_BOTF4|nr:hypothetical protein BofuT4_P089630.1 [Botrytis cinerea T4]
MCFPANVARYYCDNRMDDRRYQRQQLWNGCHNHRDPELRNRQFIEDENRRPCYTSLNPPLPTDICPDHRAELGNDDSNIIKNNVRVLLERLREASNYRELATGAPDIREHAYFDVLYYSDWLDAHPRENEQFAEYGDHPQHPRPPRNWGDRTRGPGQTECDEASIVSTLSRKDRVSKGVDDIEPTSSSRYLAASPQLYGELESTHYKRLIVQ